MRFGNRLSAAFRAFVAVWWERHGEKEMTVKELWDIAVSEDTLDLGKGQEQSQKTRLGKLLSDNRDRVFTLGTSESTTLVRIQRGETIHRARRWSLRDTGTKSVSV